MSRDHDRSLQDPGAPLDEDALRHEDAALRDAFAALRARDAERAPSYRAMIDRARRAPSTRRPLRWAAGAGLAAAAAVAGLLLWPGDGERSFEEAVASYSATVGRGWESPTASLLDVPGRSLLGTVPTIGVDRGAASAAPRVPDLELPGGGG